jgi:chromosome segregation ATPase
MATLKDERTELADMNHNLNDELNTAKHQNERFEQLITKYESTIDNLENHLLPESDAQLKDALDTVRRHDEMVTSFSDTIPTTQNALAPSNVRINLQSLNDDSR